jgi:hypothetical protein
MKMMSLRRVLSAVAVLAGTAALVSPALAQAPPGPPVCGAVASLMNISLIQDGGGAVGDNLLSVPGISPINNNPSSANNGFKQMCTRFGLATAGSSILQFNAQSGTPVTFTCDQPSPPTWIVGQGVLIRPAAAATGKVPGVECAQPYRYFADGPAVQGDNVHPVPLTIALIPNNPQVYCDMMGLRPQGVVAGDTILDFNPAGTINTHVCGTAPLFNLTLGRALLVRPSTQGICTASVCTRGLVGNACAVNSNCDLTGGAAAVTGTPVIF